MQKFYFSFFISLLTISSWSQDYKRMISEGTYTVEEIQTAAELYFEEVGTERGKGYKPYRRWEYQALRNMDEGGKLKTPDFYFNELENYNRLQNEKGTFAKTTVGTWEQLGPTSWNQTSGWNPGVGRITSLAFENGNTNHIIVGSQTGGVWKTTDGGTNWSVLTDNLSNLVVYALAIVPTDATTYFWGSSSGTIFKSIDSGATWNVLADTGGGNVNKILIDPSNTNKMYCSVEYGGIYKSINGGTTWTRIHASATNGYDIEFKPGNTNTIYASGDLFYKSVDGGTSFNISSGIGVWTQEYVNGTTDWLASNYNQNYSVSPKTGSLMGLFYISDFSHPETRLISPSMDLTGATDPELKFSHTQVNWDGDVDDLRVLYKTSSGGSWLELASYTTEVTTWSDITLSLPDPSADYYIAFEGKADYARGLTLDDVSVVDPTLGAVFANGFESATDTFSTGPKMIGVSSNDPSIVYLLEATENGTFAGLHKSTDNGDTFTQLDHTAKNYFGYSSDADDDRGQAPRDMDIAVNPSDVNEVHIAGINTWLSTDGGDSFSITSQWNPGTVLDGGAISLGYCHADVDILKYVDGKLFVGSDGGIFVANDPTIISSTLYTDLTAGLGIRQFYKIGVSQTDPAIVTGGSQDNGTSIMDNSESWSDWLGADGMETFVDKNDSDILYGTSQYGIMYKSITGGNSYEGLTKPDDKGGDNSWNWITPFEQDPTVQNTIYVAFDEVYKSVDSGVAWSSISQNLAANIDELKIAPSNNNIMYASINATLYKTSDGGATDWASLMSYSGGNINSIAIHPSDPDKVAVATTDAQKVYVTIDGGVNWTSYLYDLPNFSALALAWQDNNGDDGLYVGMNYGVYYIDNTTPNSWQPFSNNLPNVRISELEINTTTNQIYAATYGRGLWRSDIYDSSLSATDFELNYISLYPNPASKEVNLSLNRNDDVSIRIFNSFGKLVYFSKNNTLKIDVSKYASGLYFVKVNNINGFVTKKLIID